MRLSHIRHFHLLQEYEDGEEVGQIGYACKLVRMVSDQGTPLTAEPKDIHNGQRSASSNSTVGGNCSFSLLGCEAGKARALQSPVKSNWP